MQSDSQTQLLYTYLFSDDTLSILRGKAAYYLSWALILYVSTFALFLLLRVITGISIRRLGYLSLRYIDFSPRPFALIRINAIGITVHAPTSTCPSWIGFYIKGLHVKVDPELLYKDNHRRKAKKAKQTEEDDGGPARLAKPGSALFYLLKFALSYRNYLDFNISDITLELTGVSNIMIGSISTKIDLRTIDVGEVDLSKFVGTLETRQYKKHDSSAFLRVMVSDLMYQPVPAEEELHELSDFVAIDVKGILNKTSLEVKDLSLSCKLGSIHLRWDRLMHVMTSLKKMRPQSKPSETKSSASYSSLGKTLRIFNEAELKITTSHLYKLPVTFFASKEMESAPTFALSLKDFSFDLHRLNNKNPAFRLFFADEDAAHQAIVTGSSLMLGVDYEGEQEELVYIPHATVISKTNILSKIVKTGDIKMNEKDRNETILRANINITTPSLSMESHFIGALLGAFLQSKSGPKTSKQRESSSHKFQRLWPRATIKLTIDEPAARVFVHKPQSFKIPLPNSKLPVESKTSMVVLNCKKMYCDLESSYTTEGEADLNYKLNASFQLNSAEALYRSSNGSQFEFLNSDSFSLKAAAALSPALSVKIQGQWNTIRIMALHSEVLYGLREVVYHVQKSRSNTNHALASKDAKDFVLRKLPWWLESFKLDVTDAEAAMAADQLEHQYTTHRGLRIGLSKMSVGYLSSIESPDKVLSETEPQPGDGRCLSLTTEGFTGFKIVDADSNQDKIFEIANFSSSLTTSHDATGPVVQCEALLPTVYVEIDVGVFFLISICIGLVGNTLMMSNAPKEKKEKVPIKDIINFCLTSTLVKVKANLLDKAKLMLEFGGIQVDFARDETLKAFFKVIRAYTAHPSVADAWTRFIAGRDVTFDFKDSLKHIGKPAPQDTNEQLLVSSEGLRFNMPHRLVVYNLVDNFIMTMKTANTLMHRALHDDPTYTKALTEKKKMPEVPKIRIKSKTLLVSFEDDLFESKLNLIFQVGQREQAKRLEKEELFEAEVAKIMKESAEAKHRCSKSEEQHKNDPNHLRIPHDHYKDKTKHKFRQNTAPSIAASARTGNDRPTGFTGFRKRHAFHTTEESQDKNQDSELGDAENSNEDDTAVSIQKARYQLDQHHSTNWILEYNNAEANQKASIRDQIASTIMNDTLDSDIINQERIVDYSPYPFLAFLLFTKMDWFISKPKFTEDELRNFIQDIGKGQPRDTKYSLLVPLYNILSCGSLRLQLRDYPLPLIYFPDLHPTQKTSSPSVQVMGNFCIAETLSLSELHMRKMFTPIDSLASVHESSDEDNPFKIKINRAVATVKMFTDLQFQINTMHPSIITWCVSMQPAMQAFMQVFDLLSKPPIDPSSKLGFWDKIRSVFHARITFKWPKGNVHLQLKGSSKPYKLLGKNAGFVMCWKNNVVVRCNGSRDPKELITFSSDDFIMAVPDYTFQEREYLSHSIDKTGGLMRLSDLDKSTVFQKIVMKLSGRVKWTGGLLFERASQEDSSKRTFKSRPHYDIKLTNPEYIEDKASHDAYRGFRSDYLHMAISVTSVRPANMSEEAYLQHSYNSIHLTPQTFSHFYKWFSLFNSALSLPIRAGRLFHPGKVPKPKKFGQHLYTVKYQIQLSPLFMNHSYVHKSYMPDEHSCTGLKAKIDKFFVDMHQRRKRVDSSSGKRWKMGLNIAEMDVVSTDLRVLTAIFREKDHKQDLAKKLGVPVSPESSITNESGDSLRPDSSISGAHFDLGDADYSWVDSDDYTEIGEVEPNRDSPRITVLPLMYTPRWAYFRQTDPDEHDANGMMPFGNEPSHNCLIGKESVDDIHTQLLQYRMDELEEQLKTKETMLESLQKDFDYIQDRPELSDQISKVKEEVSMLRSRIEKIGGLQDASDDLRDYVQVSMEESAQKIARMMSNKRETISDEQDTSVEHDANPDAQERQETLDEEGGTSFGNRFIVHSVQIKYNMAIRNAIFSYMHRVDERRATSYFLTQRAVRYLDDLMKKQQGGESASSRDHMTNEFLGDIVQTLKHSASRPDLRNVESGLDDIRNVESDSFRADDQYLIKLVSPQIQLVNEQNPDYCVLLMSENIEMKIIAIKDTERDEDDGTKVVESRYGVSLQDAQFFVLNQTQVKSGAFTLFSSNTYGCSKGGMWPPWLSIDCCYDSTPLKDALIIDRTSVRLRYDKPNSLRVQNAKQVGNLKENVSAATIRDKNHRQNRIGVDFPKVIATCDSNQFFAMYKTVMNLLIYTEPMQKERSERLDKVLLATDFTNLENASKRVVQLQTEVRNLSELRGQFMVRSNELTSQTVGDLAKIEVEQKLATLELFVMMEAIKTRMQKVRQDDDTARLLKWAIGADQVIWHLLDDNREPFLDIGLANASFNRVEGSDGFNVNSVEVGMMQGFSLVPETFYPEVFSPYVSEENSYDDSTSFMSAHWTMLDPIGGITIVQQFDINLKPIKVQLDAKTWDMIFDYVFPKTSGDAPRNENPFAVKSNSFMEENGENGDNEDDGDNNNSDSSDTELDTEDESELTSVTETEAEAQHNNTSHFGRNTFRKMLPDNASSVFSSTSSSVSVSSSQNSGYSRQDQHSTPSGSDKKVSRRRRLFRSKKKDNDDISLMLQRASNYLSIVEIRLNASTLCVSYKGEGSHNILDIHEFVLTLPPFVYKNKTWSNMDIVLQLKKDVTKILFAHTGKLINNKFKRHNKLKSTLQLKQLKNYVGFTSVSDLTRHSSGNSHHQGLVEEPASFDSSRSHTGDSSQTLQLPEQDEEDDSTSVNTTTHVSRMDKLRQRADTIVKPLLHITGSSSGEATPAQPASPTDLTPSVSRRSFSSFLSNKGQQSPSGSTSGQTHGAEEGEEAEEGGTVSKSKRLFKKILKPSSSSKDDAN